MPDGGPMEGDPDAHGKAALMLCECLITTLVEHGVLPKEQALATVSEAIEAQQEVVGNTPGHVVSIAAIGLLRGIERSLAALPSGTGAGGSLEQRLSTAMRAAQTGDKAAYQRLLGDCVPVVAAAVEALGLRNGDRDAVVEEALLAIHRARATYHPARPLLPWLRAIARHSAGDWLRRHGRLAGAGRGVLPAGVMRRPGRPQGRGRDAVDHSAPGAVPHDAG